MESAVHEQTSDELVLNYARDVSSTTVLKRYIALNMVLDSALKAGDLIDNPMKGIIDSVL